MADRENKRTKLFVKFEDGKRIVPVIRTNGSLRSISDTRMGYATSNPISALPPSLMEVDPKSEGEGTTVRDIEIEDADTDKSDIFVSPSRFLTIGTLDIKMD